MSRTYDLHSRSPASGHDQIHSDIRRAANIVHSLRMNEGYENIRYFHCRERAGNVERQLVIAGGKPSISIADCYRNFLIAEISLYLWKIYVVLPNFEGGEYDGAI